ncbi:MAG: tail fiber domain-containing protein [Bacteroidetes bacterium]|nr:tail fiber domain-containing protein [Bacteroidota bacterium]
MKKLYTSVFIFSFLFFGEKIFSQNIGVNTDGSAAAPGVMLDVKGTNPLTTSGLQNIFQIKSFDGNIVALKLHLGLYTDPNAALRYGVIDVIEGASTNVNLSIQPSGGNVGIGTISPQNTLHVVSTFPNTSSSPHPYRTGIIVEGDQNTFGGRVAIRQAGTNPCMTLYRNNGTIASPTTLIAGDMIGNLAFGGYDGSVVIASPGITSVAAETWTPAAHGWSLVFNTINTGTSGSTEKMRLSSEGNLGIGIPTPTSKLHVFNTNPALTIESDNQYAPVLTANQNANLHASWNTIQPGSAFNFNCDLYGSVNRIETTSGQTGTITGTYGSTNDVYNNGTGTITNAYGSTSYVRNISTGTITNAIGLQANVTNVSSGTITNGYGVFVSAIQATNKYSLYASDATAPSYFAGNVSMGDPTAYARLDVKGSGSTNATYAFGVRNSSDIYSLVVADNGYVGIGTIGSFPAPLMPLHLHSTVNNFHAIRLTAENTTRYWDIVKRGNTYPQPDNFVIAYWNGGSWQEEFQITPAGNFGMGVNNPVNKLEVFGNISATADIYLGACGVWLSPLVCSDIRYKKDIVPMKEVLPDVMKLVGVKYNWRKDEFPDSHFDDKRNIGLIAQDMEKVFPEIVNTNDKGYKSIDYAKLTPVLVEAIKELKTENDSLKAENTVILNEVKNLKADMEKIKIMITTQASK